MKQELAKQILSDLCGRLPHNVVMRNNYGKFGILRTMNVQYGVYELEIGSSNPYEQGGILTWKPCLRPMDSMTEDEMKQLKKETCPLGTGTFNTKSLLCPMNHFGEDIPYTFMHKIIRWLNAKHFDYNGLIDIDAAIAMDKDEIDNAYKNIMNITI